MSHRVTEDEFSDYGSPLDSPALQPGTPMPPAAAVPVPPSPRGEALRSSLLRKPLDANAKSPFQLSNRPPPPAAPAAAAPPAYPPKFR
jgi:hypothetical protein